MARRTSSWPVWLRRSSQTCFVLLFLYIFLQAAYHPVNEVGRHTGLFFQFDPLVLLTSFLSSHQILSGLFFSLITLGVTVVVGRWFCGWVCPFGALHSVMSSFRRGSAKHKLTIGGYSRWQKSKYYLLTALVVAAALGLNLAGWFDPFSLLYRSLATVIYPAANDGTKLLFGWIYQSDPGIGVHKLTSVTEPIYEFLRRTILPSNQPYFYGAFFLAILFFAALLLNLYRPRFWCRYVCPLGAMLGIAGKNPVVQIVRNSEACNDCRLCVSECQGGANPDVTGGWKASECFYCFNCQSACPRKAISFGLHVPGGRK